VNWIRSANEISIALSVLVCLVMATSAQQPPSVELRGHFIAASANAKPEHHLPVVRIAIANDTRYKPGGPLGSPIRTDLLGLIDTGADGIAIDKGIAEALGMRRLPTREMTAAGTKVRADFYDGQLVLMDINYVLTGELTAIPWREGGSAYDAIIGMDLLRRFDVRINRKENLVLLRYLGE
jgi:predicted aspartyl protease